MRKTQLTVHLEPHSVVQLHERGSGSDRGPSEVLRRKLEILDSLVVHCDPRVTRGFPDDFYDFLVSFLTAPWSIPPDRILSLEAYVAQKPGFLAAAETAGIDPAELRAAIRGLTFAERLVLLDAAEFHHTQPPAASPNAAPVALPNPSAKTRRR